jgi:outer membrane protein assembly factor BamB
MTIRSLLAVVALAQTGALADFRFVHVTDTHFMPAGDHARNLANRVLYQEINSLAPAPAFVINTGDVVEIGHPSEYAHQRDAAGLLSVPQYFAPGNHDVRWNPLGKAGFVSGVDQPLRRHWSHEGVHFILLDSTVLLEHHGHLSRDQLDWLGTTLTQIGSEAPVVIGFHHWVGRDHILIDNEREFLQTIDPFNVVLLLQGHGHSDLLWNVNGTWAVMHKGLYQGSYMVADVDADSISLSRRREVETTNADGTKSVEVRTPPLIDIPLARAKSPRPDAGVVVSADAVSIAVDLSAFGPGATSAYRLNAGEFTPLDAGRAQLDPAALMPGSHVVETRITTADGRVYIDHDEIQLGDAPVFVTQLDGAVQSRIVVDQGTVYATTMAGTVHALDAETGRERWKFVADDAVFSTPEVRDSVVYFGSADQHVYAIDQATGSLRWKTRTGGAVLAGPAVAQGIVAIGSADTNIYGLRVEDGSIVWTLDAGNLFQSKAATDGERFFVGGWDNHFRGIDATTGREIWKRELGRRQVIVPDFSAFSPAITSPVVADGIVYVSTNDGTLHALNTADGSTVWTINRERMGYSSPAVSEGVVYVVLNDKSLAIALDAKTGEVKWEVDTRGTVYDSGMAVGTDTVHVGLVEGVLLALDRATGAEIRRHRLDSGFLFATPAVSGDRVFVSTMTGRLQALPVR